MDVLSVILVFGPLIVILLVLHWPEKRPSCVTESVEPTSEVDEADYSDAQHDDSTRWRTAYLRAS